MSTVSPEDLNAVTASVFEGHIGLVFTETTPDRVCATVAIGPELRQAAGVVHGGAYCSIVESVASWGGLLSLDGAGHVAGVNNNTDFPRSARGSTLLAQATAAVGQVRLHNVRYEAA